MIKPKGRPASQCQHCREQRKLKSLHISCSCDKKGGTHASNCLKNPAGCTCYHTHKSKIAEKSKKKDKGKDSENAISSTTSIMEGKITIDDEFIKSNSDLFEFLNSNQLDLGDYNNMKSSVRDSDGGNHKNFDKSMDFPLFPLIGTQSFDNENMPLSSLPSDQPTSSMGNSNQTSSVNNSSSHSSNQSTSSPTPAQSSMSINNNDGYIINNAAASEMGSTNGNGITTTHSNSNPNFQVVSSIARSHSFKNRPSSVLSVNSGSSFTDSKFDAYPPSGNVSNINSSSNLNIAPHSPQNADVNVNNNHNSNVIMNPVPTSKNFPFGNILESNELYISDEDLEHFLNDYDNNQ
ncbi:hypothetical protein CANTEDRAFT_114577 [Yamadazyma tenuis ATCC 10573]|nr:uncharacterized protein CANTEDRAFT_114577 [Yamadazyma tenuis ATCC 10573]EGV63610.1 hypothetical protein CANTEDRAFT_114577 [Yamadazyma tenuis ATCC 10573]